MSMSPPRGASCSHMPANLAPKASSPSASTGPIGRGRTRHGSRPAARPASRFSGSGARIGISEPQMDRDDIHLIEDRKAPGEWRVEYVGEDGGCFVNIFAGPRAEDRARDYLNALRTG